MFKNPHSKTALLIIDMINPFQFKHGNQLLNHTKDILQPILQLKERASKNKVPTIYINDHYNLWQADFKKIIDVCKTRDNIDLISSIAPSDDDYFLIKPKHSAFYGTSLHTLLYQLEVRTLIITGIAGNICVLFTANDAYMREYHLYCPKDCIASVDVNDNTYALTMMSNVLKANITQSNHIPLKA
jgi:nicotinamidase-related amidase